MATKDHQTVVLQKETLSDIRVQVARVEERLMAMDKKQDELVVNVNKALLKIEIQQESIFKYKNDRNWVIGIFGVFYAGLIAWVKSR
jgi:uncharacterized membrane protein